MHVYGSHLLFRADPAHSCNICTEAIYYSVPTLRIHAISVRKPFIIPCRPCAFMQYLYGSHLLFRVDPAHSCNICTEAIYYSVSTLRIHAISVRKPFIIPCRPCAFMQYLYGSHLLFRVPPMCRTCAISVQKPFIIPCAAHTISAICVQAGEEAPEAKPERSERP